MVQVEKVEHISAIFPSMKKSKYIPYLQFTRARGVWGVQIQGGPGTKFTDTKI